MTDKKKARAGINDAGLEVKLHGHDSDAKTNAQARIKNPTQCPRFDHCGAPICPFDDGWRKRSHLRRESICLYLREAVKPGAEANLAGRLPSVAIESLFRVVPDIAERHGDIRRRLARASGSASKLAGTSRLERANE